MKLQAEITLAADAATIWDYVQDADRRPEWDRSVHRVEKRFTGPLMAGGILRITATPGGPLAFVADWEYISYQRPERSAVKLIAGIRGMNPFRHMAGSWVYHAEGEATRFTLTTQYEVKGGWAGRWLDRLVIAPMIRRQLDESLAVLAGKWPTRADGAPPTAAS